MSLILQEINVECQDSTGNDYLAIQKTEDFDTEMQNTTAEMNLHLACQNGNLELFAKCFKLNSKLESSVLNEALYIAIDHDQIDIVKFLLNNGVNPNVKSDKFSAKTPDLNSDTCGSALHVACHKGNDKIMKILIVHGADVNLMNDHRNTPLFVAIIRRNLQVVELLLKNGADVNIQNSAGITALYIAVTSAVTRKQLKSSDAIVPRKIRKITSCEKLEIVKILCKYASEVNIPGRNGSTVVHIASAHKGRMNIAVLLTLLKHGGNPNIQDNRGNTPLHEACWAGRINYVKAILKHGGNPNVQNKEGKTSLHFAALLVTSGKIARSLIEKGANPNIKDNRGYTPLHESCCYYRKCNFRIILDNGANHNIQNNEGKTPLHLVIVREDCEDLLIALLDRGASPNVQDCRGRTPLFDAENAEYIKILLKNGGNPNIQNNFGETALYCAVYRTNSFEKICIILDNGGDPNIPRIHGGTAIHNAIKLSSIDTVRVLLKYCDINVVYGNKTLFEFTMKCCSGGDVILAVGYEIIKRDCANFNVHAESLPSLEHFKNEFESFKSECQEELKKMKCETIGNSKATFYNILKGTTSTVASLAKNKDIVEVMLSDYVHNYPIYENMMAMNFKAGLEKKELREKAFEKFILIFNNLQNLPNVCIHKIISFLTNIDMKLFTNL